MWIVPRSHSSRKKETRIYTNMKTFSNQKRIHTTHQTRKCTR
ncbi:unnamed protein product [Spirodela intermedia]|uniref:Uncharacterized protein n=2 Tax=Spirodela intermedia TaxID=51605 RepID=A0A7I8IF76_SPIIN|nr:unnamed protein product [Spirodela intermedia]CAA6655753.1 unnamed protein product [Spirodela intermedia]CAA7391103.1 unnamed protein product [Spirodela intermedia]